MNYRIYKDIINLEQMGNIVSNNDVMKVNINNLIWLLKN